MFQTLEEEARKNLRNLYEDYIKDKDNPELEQKALWCEQKYGGQEVLSKEVSHAGWKASDIALKELDLNEAKEILKALK